MIFTLYISQKMSEEKVLVDYRNNDYRGFIFLVHEEFGLLLLHCTRKKNKPPHWQLPGGHIDENEFVWAGMLNFLFRLSIVYGFALPMSASPVLTHTHTHTHTFVHAPRISSHTVSRQPSKATTQMNNLYWQPSLGRHENCLKKPVSICNGSWIVCVLRN